MKKANTAKGLMAVAMFIFGTLAPFVRNINVSSGELALYRAVLAALLVGGGVLILGFALWSELPMRNKQGA